MLLEHGVEITDGLEDDPALRVTDVGCDLALLLMDLEALGSPFAASAVLAATARPVAIRVTTRWSHSSGSTTHSCARRGRSSGPARLAIAPTLSPMARTRLALAERLAWRTRHPGLIVVSGLSATGKTTFASLLAERSGLRHLSSRRTYAELGRLAGEALQHAGGVIVDATFRDADDRAAFLEELGGLPVDAVVSSAALRCAPSRMPTASSRTFHRRSTCRSARTARSPRRSTTSPQ